MVTRQLALSFLHPTEPTLAFGFDCAEKIRQILPGEGWQLALELAVERAGYEGQLSDNFDLDLIDSLYRESQNRGYAIASLFLPMDFNKNEKELGLEISAVNGWIDLAAYFRARYLRMRFVSACDFSRLLLQNTLKETLNYIQEYELRVAFSTGEADSSILEPFIHSLQNEYKSNVGMDRIIKMGEMSEPVLSALPALPNISLSLAVTEPLTQKDLHKCLELLEAKFGDDIPLVLLMLSPEAVAF